MPIYLLVLNGIAAVLATVAVGPALGALVVASTAVIAYRWYRGRIDRARFGVLLIYNCAASTIIMLLLRHFR